MGKCILQKYNKRRKYNKSNYIETSPQEKSRDNDFVMLIIDDLI